MSENPLTLRSNEQPMIGDKVVIIRDGVEVKFGDNVVDIVSRGQVFLVRSIEDEWIEISRGSPGYVAKTDVISLEHAIEHWSDVIRTNPQVLGLPHWPALEFVARRLRLSIQGSFGVQTPIAGKRPHSIRIATLTRLDWVADQRLQRSVGGRCPIHKPPGFAREPGWARDG
jgi:hypothetical protein